MPVVLESCNILTPCIFDSESDIRTRSSSGCALSAADAPHFNEIARKNLQMTHICAYSLNLRSHRFKGVPQFNGIEHAEVL